MAVPNIRIDIASVFKDKGFKQAEKSSSALETQFKRLGKTFLTVFSAAAIIRFGKESVRAFAEEEKAARRLEQTLKGVNLGFTTPAVESYLQSLENLTKVDNEQLRPALEKLIRTTGSVTASQEILSTAIDVSAGSGVDLITVADDLGRAFLGNARGLTKYNTTLTRADLQTKSFAEIQKVLNDQFSGQRAAFLGTYAGKIESINLSYNRMQDAIGEGLIDAFGMLSGDQGIAGATSAMEEFGTISADVIRGVGSLLGNLTSQFGGSGGLQNIIDLGAKMNNPLGTALKALQDLGAGTRPLMFPTLGIGAPGYAAQQKKIEEEAAKRAKRAEALRLKEIKQREKIAKLKKLSAQLDKAAQRFDEKRIQIAAALQGRISEEERKRLMELLLIEETKQAIQEGDLERAEKLFKELEELQKQTFALADVLTNLSAGNPFDEADSALSKLLSSLDEAARKKFLLMLQTNFSDQKALLDALYTRLNDFLRLEKGVGAGTITGGNGGVAELPPPIMRPPGIDLPGEAGGEPEIITPEPKPIFEAPPVDLPGEVGSGQNLPEPKPFPIKPPGIDLPGEIGGEPIFDSVPGGGGGGDTYFMSINVDGNVTTEQDLIEAITDGLYKAQRAGKGLLFSSVAI